MSELKTAGEIVNKLKLFGSVSVIKRDIIEAMQTYALQVAEAAIDEAIFQADGSSKQRIKDINFSQFIK